MTSDEDERLVAQYRALSPSLPQVARLQVRVLDGWERRPRPLWREWVNLLRARPLQNTGWMVTATLILFFTTPLGAIASALLQMHSATAQLTQRAEAQDQRASASKQLGTPASQLSGLTSFAHSSAPRCAPVMVNRARTAALFEPPNRAHLKIQASEIDAFYSSD